MFPIRQVLSQSSENPSIELTFSSKLKIESSPELKPASSPADFFIATAGSEISEEISRLYQKCESKGGVLSLLDSETFRISQVSKSLRFFSGNPFRCDSSLDSNRFKAKESLKELDELKKMLTKIKDDLSNDFAILHGRILDTQSLCQKLKLGHPYETFMLGPNYPREWPCKVQNLFRKKKITIYNADQLNKIRTFYSDYTNHLFSLRLTHIAPLITRLTQSLLSVEETKETLKTHVEFLNIFKDPGSPEDDFNEIFEDLNDGLLPFSTSNPGPSLKRSPSGSSLNLSDNQILID